MQTGKCPTDNEMLIEQLLEALEAVHEAYAYHADKFEKIVPTETCMMIERAISKAKGE